MTIMLAPVSSPDGRSASSERIAVTLDEARGRVARTVNTAMVHAYGLRGRENVEVKPQSKQRAEYGEQLLEHLANRLTERFGKGVGMATLRRSRAFYLTHPRGSAISPTLVGPEIRSALLIESPGAASSPAPANEPSLPPFPPLLGWSHYLALLRVASGQARSFYEIEAARKSRSVRELERPIAALLFEQLAQSRTPDQVLALARQGQQVAAPADVLKDPFVLEFLDLTENPTRHLDARRSRAFATANSSWAWTRRRCGQRRPCGVWCPSSDCSPRGWCSGRSRAACRSLSPRSRCAGGIDTKSTSASKTWSGGLASAYKTGDVRVLLAEREAAAEARGQPLPRARPRPPRDAVAA
jgi:DUF1016 N-terminal domain